MQDYLVYLVLGLVCFMIGLWVGLARIKNLFAAIVRGVQNFFHALAGLFTSPAKPAPQTRSIPKPRGDLLKGTLLGALLVIASISIVLFIVRPNLGDTPPVEVQEDPLKDTSRKTLISQSDSSVVTFIHKGTRSMYGTTGRYYLLELASPLKRLLGKGEYIFELAEFLLDCTDTNPNGVNAWKTLTSFLEKTLDKTDDDYNYYLFVKGFADSSGIPNDQNFGRIDKMSISDYLNRNSQAQEALRQKIYYFNEGPTNNQRATGMEIVPEPYSFDANGYSNQDLTILRSDIMQACFLNNASEDPWAYPIGIISGSVIEEKSEKYRTIEFFLYQTNDTLEVAMNQSGLSFERYFKQE